MRVLQVIKGLGPGGAERLLVSLAAVADEQVRYDVAYVLPWKQHLLPEFEAQGVSCHLLGGHRGLADPRWVARLRGVLRRGRYDVVHIHSPALAAPVRLFARGTRPRPVIVSTEHNEFSSFGTLTRWTDRVTAGLDDDRVAVSDEVRAALPGRMKSDCSVIVHGVDVAALSARRSERSQIRTDRGWSATDVVISVVANLRSGKDYPTLIDAAEQAVAAEPSLRFVSIGQGPLEDELRARVARSAVSSRFDLLGYHEDPPSVLAGADAFTLSSRHEGLSIALLEALALGLPVVVTDVGANASVVGDDAGIVVPAGSPDALAAGYLRVAREPTMRSTMSSAATRRAESYDIKQAARLLEARYRSLLATHARGGGDRPTAPREG